MVVSVYRSLSSTANEDESLLLTLRTAARHNGKLLILGDFNTPEINWGKESAPSGSFGHALLNLLHDEALVQHVREDTRWRDGSRPNRLDLVITKGANDIESIQVMTPLGKSDHALLHLIISIRGTGIPAMAEVIIIKDEIKAQLQALKSIKAAGPDDIHPAILKPLAEVLAVPLAKPFN
ncbi:unnamed protein product [Echinostoma caproni]|uniref:Endo/exonuclease/phosphatase domain-containing protein n=1 Tax=Echinostoma caproni TaxID=27848 RepID=A0A183A1M8_9TREM|nr:unnamed protein product [Echinostoma caproni]